MPPAATILARQIEPSQDFWHLWQESTGERSQELRRFGPCANNDPFFGPLQTQYAARKDVDLGKPRWRPRDSFGGWLAFRRDVLCSHLGSKPLHGVAKHGPGHRAARLPVIPSIPSTGQRRHSTGVLLKGSGSPSIPGNGVAYSVRSARAIATNTTVQAINARDMCVPSFILPPL